MLLDVLGWFCCCVCCCLFVFCLIVFSTSFFFLSIICYFISWFVNKILWLYAHVLGMPLWFSIVSLCVQAQHDLSISVLQKLSVFLPLLFLCDRPESFALSWNGTYSGNGWHEVSSQFLSLVSLKFWSTCSESDNCFVLFCSLYFILATTSFQQPILLLTFKHILKWETSEYYHFENLITEGILVTCLRNILIFTGVFLFLLLGVLFFVFSVQLRSIV